MDTLSLALPATDLSPIIITAPAIRSGTTLLQRLLCSAPNTLIYGETCALDLEFFLQVFLSKSLLYRHNKAQFATRLEKFQAGEVNDWILDLMPDIDGYLAEMARGAFSGMTFCRDYAARSGRPVWGIKIPGCPPPTLDMVRRMMPGARWLAVHRDVLDCVRSAKAAGAVLSLDEIRQFCRAWADSLSYLLGIAPDPNVLSVGYADLIARPDEHLDRIAAFTGAQGIDRGVLGHRVNTWTGDGVALPAGTGYTPPASLTDAECRVIDEAAGPLRQQIYGNTKGADL